MKRGWSYKSIDEIGTVARGRSRHRPRSDPALYGGEYPFVQTADIHNSDLYIRSYSQTYNEEGLRQSKLWEPGVICITNAGANTGDCAILGIGACFPDSVIAVTPHEEEADPVFLKYAIDALKPQLRRITRGATQDNLSVAKLLSFKFPVPPVRVQQQVGRILRSYGDLIDTNCRRILLLEKATRLLYEEWFVRLRFPGYEQAGIVDSVPEGWKKTVASGVMDILSGGTPKTSVSGFWDGDIPFYTPKDATDYSYVTATEKSLTEEGLANCSSRLYPKDTLFITARGTVGKLNLAQRPMAMNQSCYALVGKNGVPQAFLFCALRSGVAHFRTQAVGAVFDAIIRDTFKKIPFLLPDARLVHGFEDFVSPIFRQVENLLVQNQKLREARDILLPRLMSGEIAV